MNKMPFNHLLSAKLTILVFFIITTPAYGLKNPAAVYCEELGYEHINVQVPGGVEGRCVFSNEESAEAWSFLLGETAQEFSYCNREGYTLKIVEGGELCPLFQTGKCSVCVLEDGSEVEVTALMDLSFFETTCGDGVCGLPEDYSTCPQDCSSGTPDEFCDGILDDKCDFDCTPAEDPDCAGILIQESSEGRLELLSSEDNPPSTLSTSEGSDKEGEITSSIPQESESPAATFKEKTPLLDIPAASNNALLAIAALIGLVILVIILKKFVLKK